MRKLLAKISKLSFVAAIVFMTLGTLFSPLASAASCGTATGDTPVFCYHGPQVTGDGTNSFHAIAQMIFGLLGGISIIVIIYAGLRLTLSRGNPDAIGKLRNTIIYAGVGLAIAIGATAILQFVVKGVS